jgi:hypothetical protein
MITFCWILFRVRNVLDTIVGTIKIRFLYSIITFQEIVPFVRQCEKMILQPARSQITTHCSAEMMRIACRTFKKRTQRHTAEYVIFIVFKQQQWLHERSSLLPYTSIGCLLYVYDPSLILVFLHLSVLSLQSLAQMLCELIQMRSCRGMVIDRRTRQWSDRKLLLCHSDNHRSNILYIRVNRAQSMLSRLLNPGPTTSFFELKIWLPRWSY